MKKITIYILGVIVLGLASCITLEDSFIPSKNGGMLSVMASVADFSTVNVGTKAAGDDSNVESLAMIIFDKNGKLLGKPIYRNDINSSFSIDAENGKIIDGNTPIPLVPEGENGYDLSACSIYMVANAADVLSDSIIVKDNIATVEDDRTTEDKFLNIKIPVPSIGMPGNDILIPMMGKSENPVNLSTSVSEATVANVTMRKLYAKVNVRFQVNAIQVADIPSFTIHKWTVHNIPNSVRLGEQDGETICAIPKMEGDKVINVLEPTSSTLVDGNSTIYHDPSSKDYFQFTFYVPEHKVQPDITFPYPSGIKPDEKQRYKPLLCSENRNPMYVTVNGEYVDHNSIVKGVTYSLYLGQNNSDNFEVKRNQELNNFITIKGLTNNKAAAGTEEGESQFNISVDHRVDVNFDGFSLSIEREAILDSHFEVRPLDITLSPNSSMKITIPDDCKSWIAMEDDSTGLKTPTSAYITGKGVRKYFTTNLVSELNGTNKGTLEFNNDSKNTAKHRVWIYIDENVNVYDKLLGATDGVQSSPSDGYTVGKNMYRLGRIDVEYSGEDTKKVSLNMQQWNLWRVWNKDRTRYYDIEHEEEYLNNYASDQGYGQTYDGMPWGLEGLQISDTDNAFYIQSKIGSDRLTEIFSGNKATRYKYDFYITEKESNVIDYLDNDKDGDNDERIYHPYNGLAFTKKIANKAMTSRDKEGNLYMDGLRTLVEKPQSAVEYCYNKNKRNPSTGEVSEVKWYLPAVDEIEDIAAGAYDEFDKVFQNKFYWSSQPAFTQKAWHGTFWLLVSINYDGYLYVDNLEFARSTSVYHNGVDFVPSSSGMSNSNITVELGDIVWSNSEPTESTDQSKTPNYDPGYKDRSVDNRIRAVYRSGTR